ncbi:Gfo/Idh/MocA family protein [Devosia marina]|uniref:Gfo/Idh/MocA family oxidoreductase n=1 Tax=Devosia marina TaxID=2683198 RepID=A0A7X3FQJ7_9HYPH|nr:Gfo/Idh/MocA family oxidoreductase [Devosia marina]MVS98936.1 gfo/Idh/MocA family oxidoreductase [Devosia marina]
MRVGMVGAGWVTQYHLPAWKRVNGADVVAICDPDKRALHARADAFGIAGRYASLDDMLASETLDMLDIATPRQFHADNVRAGCAHGLPILCQKPLGVDLVEAESIVAEVDGAVPLMVHENWRFRPYYRTLRNWLDEGVLGDLVAARLDFHSSGMLAGADGLRPALVRQPFFRREARLLVMEVLIHHLDSLRYLLGEFDLHLARLARSNDEIIGEDSATLSLTRRDDGLPLAVSGNLAVHGAPPAPSDQLWIWGARGTIHLDGTVLRLLGPEPREVRFDPEQSYQASYDGAIAHFAAGLGTGARFETAAADNLRTLALVEAAYRISGFQPKAAI